MNKYLVELIGTFFFVLTIGCVVIDKGAGPFAPIAIGAVLMVMIFAGGIPLKKDGKVVGAIGVSGIKGNCYRQYGHCDRLVVD